MQFLKKVSLVGMPLLALAACGSNEGEIAGDGLVVSGSSTVYPFSQAIADATMSANPDLSPISVDSTGTVEGITAFCAAASAPTAEDGDGETAAPRPDIVNASRRMTAQEFATCQSNGVTDIVELRIGTDGIVFVSSQDGGISLNVTPRILYTALAAEPYGEEQSNTNWSDVDPSLPNEAITVYGPPQSSGTRQSLLELVLKPGCTANGRLGAPEQADEERYQDVCATLRDDSGFLDQGERDDVIIRKVASNKRALAVVGYSWFEENQELVKAMTYEGIEPNSETISDGSYPASRPLFMYINKARAEVIPGLNPYLVQWQASWDGSGPLSDIGFVPASEDGRAGMAEGAENMSVLTEAALDGAAAE